MTQLAPLPWTVKETGPALRFTVTDGNGDSLAMTYGQPTQQADALAMAAAGEMLELLRAVGVVLDMSDSDHPDFADSLADAIDALWHDERRIRLLLARLDDVDGGESGQ